MEHIACTTCDLQSKGSFECNQRKTNRFLAAIREYYCQRNKTIITLVVKSYQLESNEHKQKQKFFNHYEKKTKI